MEVRKPVTELKHLDFSASEFMANGTRYLVKGSLSLERYRWYEKYEVSFGFARKFKDIVKELDKSIDLANKGKGLEAWNIIFNLKESIGKNRLDDHWDNGKYMCALFIVTENEDLTEWDEQIANKKINDWNKEGYENDDFFRLAANLVDNYIEIYTEIFQHTSEVAAQIEELKQKSKSENMNQ